MMFDTGLPVFNLHRWRSIELNLMANKTYREFVFWLYVYSVKLNIKHGMGNFSFKNLKVLFAIFRLKILLLIILLEFLTWLEDIMLLKMARTPQTTIYQALWSEILMQPRPYYAVSGFLQFFTHNQMILFAW